LLPPNVESTEVGVTRDQAILKAWQEEKKVKEQLTKATGYDKHRYRRKLNSFKRRPKIW